MGTGTAVFAHPHLSRRQVDIVIDYQQVLLRDLKAVQQFADTVPAPVHKGQRLAQHHLRFPVCHFRRHSLQQQFLPQLYAVIRLQPVHHLKPGVMAGMGVLLPGISQTDNQQCSVRHFYTP